MLEDLDPAETREWVDALDSVMTFEGADRTFFLLDEVIAEARRKGAPVPYSATTPYLNTIPPGKEDRLDPRELALDHRIRSLIRWNALAIVLRANKESSELGGHIASFQSAATLYDVGFQHFFHAPDDRYGGDLLFIQGHSSPGIYARSFVEGRLHRGSAEQVPDGNRRRRPVLLPAPVADAGLLANADRVDGPRPDHGDLPGPIPQVPGKPRPGGHLQAQGLGVPRRRGDRRAGVAGRHRDGQPGEARQPHLRDQLQPAAAGRPGPRQRQDHPGARGHLPRRGLERDQDDLGQRLGPPHRPRQCRPAAEADGGMRRRRVPGLQVQGRRVRPGEVLRQVPGTGSRWSPG